MREQIENLYDLLEEHIRQATLEPREIIAVIEFLEKRAGTADAVLRPMAELSNEELVKILEGTDETGKN